MTPIPVFCLKINALGEWLSAAAYQTVAAPGVNKAQIGACDGGHGMKCALVVRQN
jgi:hypothetical protein